MKTDVKITVQGGSQKMINSIYRPNKSKINRNSKSMMQNVESAENFIKNESLGKEDDFRSETIDVSLP